ncbi:MAG: restriction endonuclease [Bacteroidales bacterium]|nr:restriction endonuclease [Bacteroidales bacterium]MDY6427855.1 restriction endonuclease [Bacteroidales bacterium]
MIPTFDKFMLPILEWLKDGQTRTNNEARAKMIEVFNISQEDLDERLKNGDSRFNGRVNWALTYLRQAGLTKTSGRGHHVITPEGKALLDKGVKELTEKDLIAMYGNVNPQFFNSNKERKTKPEVVEIENSFHAVDPEESIHNAVHQMEEALITELLDRVKKISPSDFEKLVVELLVKMGYGGSIEDAATVTKYSGDEGIDGIIKEDILGLDFIYIQAKRYSDDAISRPTLQAFVGALSPHHAKKGVFITTSTFSKQAIEYAQKAEARIILIDGHQLCKYMLQFNLGVSTREIIEIKTIDSDYFDFN